MDNMVMGIAFGTVATVFRNIPNDDINGIYSYITTKDINLDGKPITFPIKNDKFRPVPIKEFKKLPGSPIAYWISHKFRNIFTKGVSLGEISKPRQGMATSDNNRFIRHWTEVYINNPSLA